jgi:hypothetical protein
MPFIDDTHENSSKEVTIRTVGLKNYALEDSGGVWHRAFGWVVPGM